jgi:hypothetical protein
LNVRHKQKAIILQGSLSSSIGNGALLLPIANWMSVATNAFDPSGVSSVTNMFNPDWPQGDYRIQTQ